ncbi:DUF7694 domain-containing protein [Vibrio sp. ER1A]|uniref:DUF7694 domain-containing protein n=1 Tax=Vibrio sp. ER1A TaxID=1517681 RepID=UPI0004DD3506|nr:hypothetical protein [Vibrio sp. ER1A]KFA99456.1 hypothetical protein HW45_03590 [Vibrio sp. ER1A]
MTKIKAFREVNRRSWPIKHAENLIRVFLSKNFLVQVYDEGEGVYRLSISSTKVQGSRWADGITWDELQAIKNAVGYGKMVAVEVFPENANVVNVANMRHLWVLPEPPAFMWRRD